MQFKKHSVLLKSEVFFTVIGLQFGFVKLHPEILEIPF